MKKIIVFFWAISTKKFAMGSYAFKDTTIKAVTLKGHFCHKSAYYYLKGT